MPDGKLWGISDLHVAFAENRKIVEGLRPESDTDWLIVAGDVGELTDGIEWALTLLSGRYARVVWAPGNHDLWTPAEDPVQLRGEARYRHLVEMCRSLGVLTPEDPYPVWEGAGGPAVVAPLFVLYDYTFRTDTAANKEESLAQAYKSGIVCSDEFLLHPDPYPSLDAWCRARLKESERRLRDCDPALPLVLVNHFPLVRQPTRILHYPEFAQWCGTERTADWHRRFTVSAVVYGHLHIPRTAWYDGVRFEEVSVGYPREWSRPGHPRTVPRQILPEPAR
ncbi:MULTISPECIES: metallophosphoesterase family protein [unclassified Streptomyces]|uniref:metallophosphoesterase family protein n=1 Tax=unclassified Streptomyces TaxID=2593676 RepID=UPI0020347366|nr:MULTISPECIES: metallophosphoesterase [unclassified Streptomyces]MCM2419535.1 metallophosphoesterase [Streptomyces sp. RKAG293]MCM2428269.1 metallophosphoesterase [Streptomyces sp. RKAG337]